MAISALCLGVGCNATLGGGSEDGSNPTNPFAGPEGPNGEGPEVVELPGGLELEGNPEYYRVVRLTHAQWERSVRDIFDLSTETGLSSGFVPDPPDGTFSNNERALYVTDSLSLDYERTAEQVAEQVTSDAGLMATLGASAGAGEFIRKIGKRAFRRDLTPDEVTQYEGLWAQGETFFASGDATADGARVFIEALLQSPHFVYRVELTEAGARLSGHELATKISYVLLGTTPSDELLALADSGALDTLAGLTQVVTQMLSEEGSRTAIENYHRELFGLDRYNSILKDTTRFPSYTEALNDIFLQADLMFFSHLYTTGLGFRDVLTSNVAFVESSTAPLYGVPDPGPSLTLVPLDASRPGFLTRLGFLAYNGTLSNPDPIHRGVDINNRILCADLEPPVGEIPPLPDPVPGQTNRERVTAHTEVGICKGCHGGIINPPGFSLENFDALGVLRATDNEKSVDTGGSFDLRGTTVEFSGIVDLASQIAESPTAHSCYSAHLAEYVFARDIGSGETALVTTVQNQSLAQSASLKEMLLALLESPEFATARTGTP